MVFHCDVDQILTALLSTFLSDILCSFIFTCAMLASTDIRCRHVLSFHLSQVNVLLKRPIVGSCKQCHMIAQGL